MLVNHSQDRVQLVLLHFAGGNAYSFRQMEPYLGGFELVMPELPGRGRRMNEPLVHDFEEAVTDIYHQVLKSLHSSAFMIYGHSMGAYLAFRLAQLLEGISKPPLYLLVSGSAGPGAQAPKQRHLLEKTAFFEEVYKLGGIPDDVLRYPEMLDFFEPILKADFEVAEGYQLQNAVLLNTPVFAMMGDQEELVSEIRNWKKFTHAAFHYEILEGHHFFINQHPDKIADIIRSCYRRCVI
jgi:external thioesterase TEII